MYNTIRFAISIVLLLGILIFVMKSKWKREKWAYRVCSILGLLFFILLGFIPVENIVGPIDSIEAVYEYRNPGAKVRLIIEGQESAYVSGIEDGNEMIMIVPKAKGGWYVGTGAEHKTIARGFTNDIFYTVYQYKDTTDYYIVVYEWEGKEMEISDSYGSEYIRLDELEESSETHPVYYAYVPDYDENYWISANGEKVELREG